MLYGLDVSRKHIIDWERLKQTKYGDFIYLKAVDGMTKDPSFEKNIQSAKQVKIPCGTLSNFRLDIDVDKQIRLISEIEKGDLPPAICIDDFGKCSLKTAKEKINILFENFSGVIQTSYRFWDMVIRQTPKQSIWIIDYNIIQTTPKLPFGIKTWDIWQYTSVGRVDGINVNVNINRMNKGK